MYIYTSKAFHFSFIFMELRREKMRSRADSICGARVQLKAKTQENKRVKDGFKKFREALEHDAKVMVARSSGLPKDWRSRILG